MLYEDAVQQCSQVIAIEDRHDIAFQLLQIADRMAASLGYDRLRLLSALTPDHIEHLILPECSLAIITRGPLHPWQSDLPIVKTLSMQSFLDGKATAEHKNKLSFARKTIHSLLEEVQLLLQSEKALHDELEQYYVDAMNFDALNAMTEDFIRQNI